MVFVIAVAAIMLPVLFGLGIGAALTRFDRVVDETKEEIENKDKGYNPDLTLGYKIKTTKAIEEQVKEARKLAAKMAAAQPRGANMRIGNVYNPTLKTAWEGVEQDPLTAAKIAEYHGWEGVRTGATLEEGAADPASTAAPVLRIKVYPGKDYEAIPITDSMSLDEKRKARIANAKAKWVAYQKAKEEGRYTVIESTPDAGAAQPSGQPTAEAVAEKPMEPSDTAVAPGAAPSPAATASAAVDSVGDIGGIPRPKLIEITDDMDAEAKKSARIANSKAKSAYKKALKAAGIDPKTVKI